MGRKTSPEDALNRVIAVHGDRYNLEKFVYTKATNKVIVGCKEHGEFNIRYADFVAGSGCSICGKYARISKLKQGYNEFLISARKVHGDKYNYLEQTYQGASSDITIVCKVHGEFRQRANRHINDKCGCPKCQQNGFNRGLVGSLYLLTNDKHIKIGVTNRKVETRIKEINATLIDDQPFSLVTSFSSDGEYVYTVEQELLSTFSEYRTDKKGFSGFTETFDGVAFESVLHSFIAAKFTSPPIGSLSKTVKVKKSGKSREEIKNERRKAVLINTGTPVGVYRIGKYWVFEEIRRSTDGVKYHKLLGRFVEKSDAIDFANHYHNTGNIIDTRKNLLIYNNSGLLYGVVKRRSKFSAVVNWSDKDKSRFRKNLGTFDALEDAEKAVRVFKDELLSGLHGEVLLPKYS